MRIPIREQLGAIILLSSLIGLGVISIATWITNHNFVLAVRSSRLSLTASLKSAQLASNLALMQTSVALVSNGQALQNGIKRYVAGNNTAASWANAQLDLDTTVGISGAYGGLLFLQVQVFPTNTTGLAGTGSLLNATTSVSIPLPYNYPNGTQVMLGDQDQLGFPPALYPNLTRSTVPYNSTFNASIATFDDITLTVDSPMLMVGPWAVNDTFSLVSLTVAVINNTSSDDAIAWMTLVFDAHLITDVITSTDGLDNTGELLLIGPTNVTNHYPPGINYRTGQQNAQAIKDAQVNYILPLSSNDTARHPDHVDGTADPPFLLSQYPAALTAVTQNLGTSQNSGSMVATRNEAGQKVSAGFAFVDSALCDWAIIIEEARSEVWEPITHLRKVLLACIFGTAGVMLLFAFPLAHFASAPIRRLRAATLKTVMPPGYSESNASLDEYASDDLGDSSADGAVQPELARKEGFLGSVAIWRKRSRRSRMERTEDLRRQQFRIPGKVKVSKHCVNDELSDLERTFNEMSDELMMQYERLEERVQQRTAELELSKKAAEAANESKTLFIANISHELKTPLNGIMGMCAVCMQEDDPVRLKRSLGIIYKSGDLLLNLLTDLLTFSKNQVGQQLSLDEKEFRLRDISSQITAIFENQAKDNQIDLRIKFEGSFDNIGINTDQDTQEFGPYGTGRVKDMVLWGDQHRILQVVINLVSNSLKFTDPGKAVILTIRCLGEADTASRKTSMTSKASKHTSGRARGSDASVAMVGKRMDTANEINALDKHGSYGAFVTTYEKAAPPPPGRNLLFEFEVQDTGPGIPENLHQRIFEPFVQGDLGLSKKYGGTGLGLSICSQLAGLMHGTMGLESEVGRGSTFHMKIPLRHLQSRRDSSASSVNDPSAPDESRSPRSRPGGDNDPTIALQAAPAASQSPRKADGQPRLVGLSQPFFASSTPMDSPGSQPGAIEQITQAASSSGKIRVLVAEDNKVNQEVVLRMLKLEDIYDVTVAKDGQEALDMVKESMLPNAQPYNLIFMDVQMPNLDGLQSTRLIREIGYQAPIVALTAFAEESNVKDCLDSGMNYFLSKPIRRPALKKVLKEYCAPIMEVDEDASPEAVSERLQRTTSPRVDMTVAGPSQNTTLVVISRPSSMDGPPGSPRSMPPDVAKR